MRVFCHLVIIPATLSFSHEAAVASISRGSQLRLHNILILIIGTSRKFPLSFLNAPVAKDGIMRCKGPARAIDTVALHSDVKQLDNKAPRWNDVFQELR